jgi:hypothetical protein
MAELVLSTSASSLKGVGWKPFAVGGAGALVVGGTGFTVATSCKMLVYISSVIKVYSLFIHIGLITWIGMSLQQWFTAYRSCSMLD